jgi:hypothetical protein
MRTYVSIAVLVVILGGVLYAVRNNQSAGDLEVGTCFDRPASGDTITTVEKHPCTEAHDAEVMFVGEYPNGDANTPASTISSYIDTTCEPIFASYVGVPVAQSADLSYGWYYPDTDAWNSGERTFSCFVARIDDGKLTKSVKGSGGS